MNKVDLNERKEKIASLYLRVLGQEADDPGLNAYLYSDISLEDIEAGMRNSPEYQELQRKNNFSKQLGSLGTGELLLMGSSPRSDEHVESLKSTGVVALLSLDGEFERPYNHLWCEHFLSVPLAKDKPITVEQITNILNFMYTNIVVNGRKTFVHSDLGMSRAPMIITLFLVAEKKMPFLQALTIVTAKQSMVNPGRSLISGEVLNHLKTFKFRDVGEQRVTVATTTSISGESGKVDYVPLNQNILVGTKLNEKMVGQFRASDVDVIVDLNETRTKLPTEAQWFSHIHLPLPEDQIKDMMPVIIKNVRKYSARGRVYVMCDEMPKLMLFAENFAGQSEDSLLAAGMAKTREQIISL